MPAPGPGGHLGVFSPAEKVAMQGQRPWVCLAHWSVESGVKERLEMRCAGGRR